MIQCENGDVVLEKNAGKGGKKIAAVKGTSKDYYVILQGRRAVIPLLGCVGFMLGWVRAAC